MCSQLAPRLRECRRWREKDAGPNTERVRGAIGTDQRHGRAGIRLQLQRPCQVVVSEQGIEQVFDDAQGIDVGCNRRIETGFATDDQYAQGFAGFGRMQQCAG